MLQYKKFVFIFIICLFGIFFLLSCNPYHAITDDFFVKNLTHEEVENFLTRGQTTKEQVKAKYGSPSSKESSSKSTEKWKYSYLGNSIPFLFLPTSIIDNELIIYFENDIVSDYSFRTSTSQ